MSSIPLMNVYDKNTEQYVSFPAIVGPAGSPGRDGYGNVNDFINPYFVGVCNDGLFPVNQEGATSWSTAGYTIDGWLIGGGSAELTQAGMILHTESSAVPWLQRLETIAVGRDYTASILADGVLYSATGKFPDNGGATVTWTNKTGDIAITASYPAEGFPDVTFNFPAKSTTTQLTAASLQLGTEQTAFKQINGEWVAAEMPDYGMELMKCQRVKIYKSGLVQNIGGCTGLGGTSTPCTIDTPVTMRGVPVVKFDGLFVRIAESNISVTAVRSIVKTINGIRFIVDTANKIGDGEYRALSINSGGYISISSEL